MRRQRCPLPPTPGCSRGVALPAERAVSGFGRNAIAMERGVGGDGTLPPPCCCPTHFPGTARLQEWTNFSNSKASTAKVTFVKVEIKTVQLTFNKLRDFELGWLQSVQVESFESFCRRVLFFVCIRGGAFGPRAVRESLSARIARRPRLLAGEAARARLGSAAHFTMRPSRRARASFERTGLGISRGFFFGRPWKQGRSRCPAPSPGAAAALC